MMPGLRARRRGDEFHALVESPSTEGAQARVDERFDADLALVGLMRSVAPEQPRPDFVSNLRAQLMAEATEVLTPTAALLTVRPRTARHERRLAVAVGGFAVISAATSMGAAAQDALPGDTLYPLKRAIENAGSKLQFNDQDRARSMLGQAADRLLEARSLIAQGDADGLRVADTLHDFTDQAGAAADVVLDDFEVTRDERSVQRLSDFTTTSKISLDQLQSGAPEASRAALIEATQVIEQISREISYLCPSCEAAIAPQVALSPVSTHLLAGPERVAATVKAPPKRAERKQPRSATDDPAPEAGDGGDAGGETTAKQPVDEKPRTNLGTTVDNTTEKLTDTVDRLVDSVIGGEDDGGNLLTNTLDTLGKTAGSLLGGGR